MKKITFVRQLCLVGLMGSCTFFGATNHANNESSLTQKQEKTLAQKLREDNTVFGAGLGAVAGLAASPLFFYALLTEDERNDFGIENAWILGTLNVGTGALIGIATGLAVSLTAQALQIRKTSPK